MVVGRYWGVSGRRSTRVGVLVVASATIALSGCGGDSTTAVSVGPAGIETSGDGVTGVDGGGIDSATGSTVEDPNADSVQSGSGAASESTPGLGSGDASAEGSPVDGTSPAGSAIEGTSPTSDGGIGWEPFGDGFERGRLDVPADYDDPTGAKFSLYLIRHRATDPDRRIGTLLVNPGGPGFPGSTLAAEATSRFSRELVERFDIVGWDPRGTGVSTPAVDCIDDYDRFFTSVDHTPEDESEHQLIVDRAEEFAAACAERTGAYLPYVGTNNSARDIDSIRRALGEQQISYFGFSYGSELGATWVTLFPDTVRAAVLDGAIDPAVDEKTATAQQMEGFQSSVEAFLDRCRSEGCAFSGDRDPEEAYLAVLADLDEKPLTVASGRPPVNRDVARIAVIEAMYDVDSWHYLDLSLQGAQRGDGSGLLALNDRYFLRKKDGSYPNYLEAFQAISCADSSARYTVTESDAAVAQLAVAAPLVVPSGTIEYDCTFFEPAIDPRVEITGGGTDAPILVIGTTGDAATPLASTKQMVAALPSATLLTVDADQHTGYRANDCSVGAVNEFLIDLTTPSNGATC